MAEGDGIGAYIQEFLSVKGCTEEQGVKLEPDLHVICLLSSLPESYDTTVKIIELADESDMSLEKAINILLEEGRKMKAKEASATALLAKGQAKLE
jgi:gag-polypeptide of LTR copia-type